MCQKKKGLWEKKNNLSNSLLNSGGNKKFFPHWWAQKSKKEKTQSQLPIYIFPNIPVWGGFLLKSYFFFSPNILTYKKKKKKKTLHFWGKFILEGVAWNGQIGGGLWAGMLEIFRPFVSNIFFFPANFFCKLVGGNRSKGNFKKKTLSKKKNRFLTRVFFLLGGRKDWFGLWGGAKSIFKTFYLGICFFFFFRGEIPSSGQKNKGGHSWGNTGC